MDSSPGNIRGRRPAQDAREAVARQATPGPVLVEISASSRFRDSRIMTPYRW